MSMNLKDFDSGADTFAYVNKCFTDHETRNNANHNEEEPPAETATESTPLMHRFPVNEPVRSPLTTVIVSLLLIILIAGVIIGIYLLVLQNDSENVLPPVELPLQLVSRTQWDPSYQPQLMEKAYPYRLRAVTIVQTGTEQCQSTETCSKLLQDMIKSNTTANGDLPYNFMISSNGQTYEALGWRNVSPNSRTSSGLLLAFIGNFTEAPPSRLQLEEAKHFFATSVSQQYLHPSYRVTGDNTTNTPAKLAKSLTAFPQWRP
ncbi:unnamed protein product [Chrysodeixis includens]|uniref:Peptidoglycan recognition protein family domain-containing protein n=1 Tax=Chrysodeixis includens TaxID=689277 RepID=A0A9N8PWH6_CHRIL|nr:unnamed protein product [Chrysodeixis includens]